MKSMALSRMSWAAFEKNKFEPKGSPLRATTSKGAVKNVATC